MKYIKHIFFDLDHTLWDFESNSVKCFEFIFKKYQLSVDFQHFMATYKPINAHYWKLYREDKISKSQLRYGRLNDTFKTINVVVNDSFINMLSEDYIEVLPRFNKLLDGTHEVLQYLETKYKLHIITNGFEEVQNLKLTNSGIQGYFDEVITSEKVGVKKPDKRVFEYALNKANATSDESIMVGDNWEADIMGAVNCGLKAIYFDFENQRFREDIPRISHLLEIKQYL